MRVWGSDSVETPYKRRRQKSDPAYAGDPDFVPSVAALKLIDQLGDEKTAVTWLVEQKGVKKGLTVRDYKLQPRFGDLPFLKAAAAVTLEALGLGSIAHQIGQTGVAQAVDRLGMDGMLALWQPAASN